MSNKQENGITRPLWAPWRIDYIRGEKEDSCFLCRIFEESRDWENLLLYRGKTCAVVMNRYPYNSGHLMVTPYRHVAEPSDLTEEETLEIAALTARSLDVLRKAMKPQGFNIGINLGESAGAGLKDHLHQHIVPRWVGDTNFMPVLGGPRVMPEALDATYDLLFSKFTQKNPQQNLSAD